MDFSIIIILLKSHQVILQVAQQDVCINIYITISKVASKFEIQ